MTMTRTYCPAGFRRVENPARTFLRIDEDRDITLPGVGPDVEAQLIEARDREVKG